MSTKTTFVIDSSDTNKFHYESIIKNLSTPKKDEAFNNSLLKLELRHLLFEAEKLMKDGIYDYSEYTKFLISLHFLSIQIKNNL